MQIDLLISDMIKTASYEENTIYVARLFDCFRRGYLEARPSKKSKRKKKKKSHHQSTTTTTRPPPQGPVAAFSQHRPDGQVQKHKT